MTIELSKDAQERVDSAKAQIEAPKTETSEMVVSNPKKAKTQKGQNTFNFVFKSGSKEPTVKLNVNKVSKSFEKYSTKQLSFKTLDFVPETVHAFFNGILPIAKSKAFPLVIGDSYGGQISVNQKGFNSFKNLFGYQDGVLFVTKNQLFDYAQVSSKAKIPHKVLDKSYVSFVATKENSQKLLAYAKSVIK